MKIEQNYEEYVSLYQLAESIYNYVLIDTEEGQKALDYLESRGYGESILNELAYGYSFRNNLLTDYFTRKKVDMEKAVEYGLLTKNEKGYRDFFYGRIMIPLKNQRGDTVGFTGRVLPHNTHPAKYINTKETAFFCKSEILYNFDKAIPTIKNQNFALLMEGYFDASTAYREGLKNTVAVMGTAITKKQMELLKRYTTRLIICLDGDSAGIENTIRNCRALLKYGFEIRIGLLPDELDPHEFIHLFGIKKFIENIVKGAMPFHQFLKHTMIKGKNLGNEIELLKYSNALLDSFSSINSSEQKELFSGLAHDVGVDENFIRHTLAAIRGKIFMK